MFLSRPRRIPTNCSARAEQLEFNTAARPASLGAMAYQFARQTTGALGGDSIGTFNHALSN